MSNVNRYEVIRSQQGGAIKYYFHSVGERNVFKTIEYFPLGLTLDQRPLYNLGFSNFDPESNESDDKSVNNNGDVYKVFNTVLSTIPLFFDQYPNGIICIEGSDSDPAYFNNCILSCRKGCIDKCKNEGRRIALYRRFLNVNYSILSQDYIFKGGIDSNGKIILEEYKMGKPYNSVLVYKRN